MSKAWVRTQAASRGHQIIAAFCLICVFITGAFACRRSIFQDEGAIILNFAAGYLGFFSPLPYYDQAAPPLAMAVLSVFYTLAGGDIFFTRFLLLLLCLAGFVAATIAAFRTKDAAIYYGLMITLAIRPIILNATELKQYVFEFLFTILFVMMHIARRGNYNWRYAALFLAVALGSILFSFSSLIIVVPVMFDIFITRETRGQRKWWALAAALFCAVWLVTYLVMVKPMIAMQFINYGKEYAGLTLLNVVMNRDMTSLAIMAREVRGIFPHLFLVVAVPVLVIAYVRAAKPLVERIVPNWRDWLAAEHAPARLMLFICGGLLAMNMVGAYPFSTTRQLLYVSPIIGFFLGWLVLRLLRAYGLKPLAQVALLWLMIAPAMLYNLVVAAQTSYVKTDVWDLYQFIKTHKYKHVVSWVIFDPTIHVFYGRDPDKNFELKGLLNMASAPNLPVDELKRRLLADDDDLPNQLWSVLKREEDFRLYVDWVVRRVTRDDTTLIATVEIFPYQEIQLDDALKAAGCSGKAVFEEKAVKAYEVHCTPK